MYSYSYHRILLPLLLHSASQTWVDQVVFSQVCVRGMWGSLVMIGSLRRLDELLADDEPITASTTNPNRPEHSSSFARDAGVRVVLRAWFVST
jgi:hypothetical protein